MSISLYDMSIKVELPQMEAQRLLEQWETRAEQLEGELTQLLTAIASVKAQMKGGLNGGLFPDQGKTDGIAPKQKKNKRGENLRVLTTYLGGIGARGASSAELSKNTGIGMSSVYAAMTKHPDVFVRGQDDLWHLKKA